MLFFASLQLHAQEPADTSITIVEEKQDVTEEDTDTNETTKFLQRWEQGGDSLQLQQRKIQDSLVKKLQKEDAFWYANAIFKKEKKELEQEKYNTYVPLGQRAWFQTLIWLIIIGGFATFLIIYLTGSNVGLFRKRNVIITEADDEIISEDIFAINYQKEIDKAASQGNHRLAVRLMYLRLLKNMAERNIIQYKQDKTNLDYLMQLHPTAYYKDFFKVTRNYEYTWYGQFNVDEEAYKIITNDFEQFERSLH